MALLLLINVVGLSFGGTNLFRVKSPLVARISVARARLYLISAVVLLMFLWQTPYIFPLKLFTVLVHEFTHAFLAYVTGGRLLSFTYDFQEGGVAVTTGGSKFLILASGYLGSAFFGGLLIALASRTSMDRLLSFVIGVGLAGITFYFAAPETKILFAYLFAFFYILAAWWLPNFVCEALLIFIGLANCCYAWIDIVSDVFYATADLSDASLLAELTGLPTLFWGSFWLLVSTSITWFFLKLAVNGRTSRDIVEEVPDGEECENE